MRFHTGLAGLVALMCFEDFMDFKDVLDGAEREWAGVGKYDEIISCLVQSGTP